MEKEVKKKPERGSSKSRGTKQRKRWTAPKKEIETPKIKNVWEKIDDFSFRLKVHGGWIVKSHGSPILEPFVIRSGLAVHQIFIPDPEFSWKL